MESIKWWESCSYHREIKLKFINEVVDGDERVVVVVVVVEDTCCHYSTTLFCNQECHDMKRWDNERFNEK